MALVVYLAYCNGTFLSRFLNPRITKGYVHLLNVALNKPLHVLLYFFCTIRMYTEKVSYIFLLLYEKILETQMFRKMIYVN